MAVPLISVDRRIAGDCEAFEDKNGCNIKRWTRTNVGKDMEKWEPSYIASGIVKWYKHFGTQFGSFFNFS